MLSTQADREELERWLKSKRLEEARAKRLIAESMLGACIKTIGTQHFNEKSLRKIWALWEENTNSQPTTEPTK